MKEDYKRSLDFFVCLCKCGYVEMCILKEMKMNKRMSLDIPETFYKQIKVMAVMKGMSIKGFVMEAVKTAIVQAKPTKKKKGTSHIPNAETVKVFEATDRGEGLTLCEDVNELFRSLEED